jgi:hypothetical protein
MQFSAFSFQLFRLHLQPAQEFGTQVDSLRRLSITHAVLWPDFQTRGASDRYTLYLPAAILDNTVLPTLLFSDGTNRHLDPAC